MTTLVSPGRREVSVAVAAAVVALACKELPAPAPTPRQDATSAVSAYIASKLCEGTDPSSAHLVTPVFREDGPPAVPHPEPADREWKPGRSFPLVPSRADGKPTFSNNWFTNNEKVWRRVLAPLAGQQGLRYLEVGVFEGQSLLWAFHNFLTHPSSHAVAIDLFGIPALEARFRENLKRAHVERRTEVLVGYSNDKLRGLPSNSFDVIYIDGSHAAHDTLRDGVLAWDLLKVGGILIFDDYILDLHMPLELRPQVAIKAILSAFHNQIRILDLGFQAVLQKVEDKCPGLCTRVGPYELYWSDDPASGALYDPRTKARVSLTPGELELLQKVLAGRVFGKLGVQVDEALVNSPAFAKLRSRLGI
jgi:predicted O-methyltransferase YrrM